MAALLTWRTRPEVEVQEIHEVKFKRFGQESTHAFCDICFNHDLKKEAYFICHDCEEYYCKKCFTSHNPSHSSVNKNVIGEEEEQDSESVIDSFLTEMMNESKEDRKERVMIEDIGVCDEVDISHRLDRNGERHITGLCGYQSHDSKWWVVCNHYNKCIKMYSLGANLLQRYIEFDLKPFDVTEIIFEQQHKHLNPASTSSSITSGTALKQGNKHLLAVTCPLERQILVLDLNKRPAIKDRIIKMKKYCWTIEFNEDKLFTVCTERADSSDSPCYVCILSRCGVKLREFRTDITCLHLCLTRGDHCPYITVLNGNIYMTDPSNHNIKCFNVKNKVMAELTIDGSMPVGISVDRSSNKLYVCAYGHNKVYEVDSGLGGYTSVLESTHFYLDHPSSLCFYGDKLYISNIILSPHVTVVQLL